MRRRGRRRGRRSALYVALPIVLVIIVALAYFSFQRPQEKPIILYINQGNGAVNESNFGEMLNFASFHGFNTIFFQVYYEGVLLFNRSQLGLFVNETHSQGLKIFFALYFTNSSQTVPAAIMALGEDGISLDMSALPVATQESLLEGLSTCNCKTAVTTTDMNSPLRPDLLILETYGPGFQQYIRDGVVASVGVFTTSSKTQYQQELQYALKNSDGVMVFDYAGLLKAGY